MLISCRSLFMGETDRLPIDAELDFSQKEYQRMYPFAQPIRVVGSITGRAGVVQLRARVQFVFEGRCDRCLSPLSRSYDIPVEHVLVTSAAQEDSDFVQLEDYHLALDELIRTDILLELPYKLLCRDDCRGLCPQCGKNLNDGLCGCQTKTVDPRLAVLQDLLN